MYVCSGLTIRFLYLFEKGKATYIHAIAMGQVYHSQVNVLMGLAGHERHAYVQEGE